MKRGLPKKWASLLTVASMAFPACSGDSMELKEPIVVTLPPISHTHQAELKEPGELSLSYSSGCLTYEGDLSLRNPKKSIIWGDVLELDGECEVENNSQCPAQMDITCKVIKSLFFPIDATYPRGLMRENENWQFTQHCPAPFKAVAICSSSAQTYTWINRDPDVSFIGAKIISCAPGPFSVLGENREKGSLRVMCRESY